MKRKIAWLALPLVLGALVWGVKWRAEHPRPTKEDLAVRAMMGEFAGAKVKPFPFTPREVAFKSEVLLPEEFAPFVDSFYFVPPADIHKYFSGLPTWRIGFWGSPNSSTPTRVPFRVEMAIDTRGHARGIFMRNDATRRVPVRLGTLHPLTTKRWLELLLAHPRIGPELRARMQP